MFSSALQVYLDISHALDPEVKLPVVVTSRLPSHHFGQTGPHPAGAGGAPSYSDFPPPTFPPGPFPTPPPPGAYGYPAPNPPQYGYPGGYTTPWPQPVAPYGFSGPTFPPSADQQQMPTAPPFFQQETPPGYSSLYPSVHGSYGNSGPAGKQ